MSPTATKIFVLCVIFILIAIDIYLAVDRVANNTYSSVLRSWFTQRRWVYFITAFALGVLMGHWSPA